MSLTVEERNERENLTVVKRAKRMPDTTVETI